MRIGILGSGLMGGELGTIFARAGHEVAFSYAHSKDKLVCNLSLVSASTKRGNKNRKQLDNGPLHVHKANAGLIA